MDVEHLWFSNRPRGDLQGDEDGDNVSAISRNQRHQPRNHIVDFEGRCGEDRMVQTLAGMADRRLYKLVKWCKSLPLFKSILVSDK